MDTSRRSRNLARKMKEGTSRQKQGAILPTRRMAGNIGVCKGSIVGFYDIGA